MNNERGRIYQYFTFLLFLMVGPFALADDPLDRLMNLRMEVETLNENWESEKKRFKSEYEKAIERRSQLKDETEKQRANLQLLQARIRGFKAREAESRRISGQDEIKLKRAVQSLQNELDGMLPIGRAKSREQLKSLAENIGEKSSEEIVSQVSKIVRDELSRARGVHLFRESYSFAGSKSASALPIEAARVGNVYAYVADENGRLGYWRAGQPEPSWEMEPAEKAQAKLVLDHARSKGRVLAITPGKVEEAVIGGSK